MTPRQERFIAEYLIDLNATQAAIRAGYSAKTAESSGPRLLGNVEVRAEIERRKQKIAAKHELTIDRIAAEWAKLGFWNAKDFVGAIETGDLTKLTDDQAAAIQSISREIDARTGERGSGAKVERLKIGFVDKRAVLFDAAKWLGAFVEKHEHEGNLTLIVETGVPRRSSTPD